MANYKALLEAVLSGRADTSIRFDELCGLLRRLGFEQRTRGSHHIFAKSGVQGQINLQPRGSMAKPYQVRQTRNVLIKYERFIDEI